MRERGLDPLEDDLEEKYNSAVAKELREAVGECRPPFELQSTTEATPCGPAVAVPTASATWADDDWGASSNASGGWSGRGSIGSSEVQATRPATDVPPQPRAQSTGGGAYAGYSGLRGSEEAHIPLVHAQVTDLSDVNAPNDDDECFERPDPAATSSGSGGQDAVAGCVAAYTAGMAPVLQNMGAQAAGVFGAIGGLFGGGGTNQVARERSE